MFCSSCSAYVEFPSRSLDPLDPRLEVSAGSDCNSCRKQARRSFDEASERKSLLEKSIELGGLVVRRRSVEFCSLWSKRAVMVISSPEEVESFMLFEEYTEKLLYSTYIALLQMYDMPHFQWLSFTGYFRLSLEACTPTSGWELAGLGSSARVLRL